jgi:hypothetical protein
MARPAAIPRNGDRPIPTSSNTDARRSTSTRIANATITAFARRSGSGPRPARLKRLETATPNARPPSATRAARLGRIPEVGPGSFGSASSMAALYASAA